MPVTRSSSHQDSLQPSSQPYQPRTASRDGPSSSSQSRKPTKRTHSAEVIVLSSDDDEPLPKPAKKSRKKATPAMLSGEVLELTSEDERLPATKPSQKKLAQPLDAAYKDAQRTIQKLQEELRRAEQRATSTCSEIEQLKREASSRNKDVLSELEEYTSCEVCALTLWNPYILPGCGHSFCEECLVDWFGRIKAQHLAANPGLDGNRTALAGHLRALLHTIPNVHAMVGPHLHNHLQVIIRNARRLRPEYTCPSCRKEVESKPVEDFRLKGLVKEIATLTGETNPREGVSSHRGDGPFDHFFPAPMPGR